MVREITTRLPVGKPLDENSRIPAVREYDDYGTLQPVAAHASQQLAWVPTRARPSLGALHWAAPCLIEHVVTPFLFVRQHATKPDRPQVDLAAHLTLM
jgi:hypothetical protein